jgi:hypothetical protein
MRWLAQIAAGLLAAGAVLLGIPAAHAARIEGEVTRHDGGKLGGPFPVLLFTFDRSGWQQSKETKTDGAGRFAFGDVQTPGFYWVSLRNEGVMYPGRVVELGATEQQQTKSVSLSVYPHTPDGPPVEVSAMQVSVEAEDAGVFRISKEIFLQNPQPVVIAHKPEAGPVVRVGLAPGHEQVQARIFPFLPVEFADKGAEMEIYGPIFPSQQIAEVEYVVNGKGRELDTELVLAQPVGELRLLLPPAEFAFEVPTLHPGPADRDQRTGALRHQTFVGFDLPAGTRIPLRLVPRSAPQPLSTTGTVLMVVAMFTVAAGLVLQPILAGQVASARAVAEPVSGENEALFIALRDLEEDFELGKISPEDRERMREELRSEALRNLANSRRSAPGTAPAGSKGKAAERSAQRCTCGHAVETGARFCSACGRRIA